ncbi:hypothetical protein [Prevotella sp. AGR2160]|uniref:hypothetical protein n=1 Tax=Prevotella sp. AGR2160 TaxID=1280674 RepID=UPI0004262EC6|nr:hypothetical protein [Prevotella sp. AGR2160]
MNKLFTLAVSALMVMSAMTANAKEEVTLGAWSPWDATTCAVSGNTITASAAWAGAGNRLANGAEGVDWSDGDYLELDLSNVTGSFNISVDYTDGKLGTDGNPVKIDGQSSNGACGEGDEVAFVKLNPDYYDQVINLWVQAQAANTSMTVDKAYLVTEEEYQAYIANKAAGEQTAWEGSLDFGTSWGASTQVAASKFATAQSGAEFTFYYTCNADAGYSQIKIMDSSWNALSSVKGVNQWGCVDIAGTTSFHTVLSDADLASVQAGGMVLSGFNATLTKITVKNGSTTAIRSMKADRTAKGAMYNLAGQRVGKDYKGIVIVNGKKLMR